MNKEQFVGVFCTGDDGKYKTYSFEEIKAVEYIDFEDGRSDTLEAVFKVSFASFPNTKGIKWTSKKIPALYADGIKIKPTEGTSLIYDVVSDLLVECAIGAGAKTVRVKVEKDSKIGFILQGNGYHLAGEDADYKYLEVDAVEF